MLNFRIEIDADSSWIEYFKDRFLVVGQYAGTTKVYVEQALPDKWFETMEKIADEKGEIEL